LNSGRLNGALLLQNKDTGRKLAIGERQTAEESQGTFDLDSKDAVGEDDVFTFRTLPAEWLHDFSKVLPRVNQLRKFYKAVLDTEMNKTRTDEAQAAKTEAGNGKKTAKKKGKHKAMREQPVQPPTEMVSKDASTARERLASEPDLLDLHQRYLFPKGPTDPFWSGPIPALCEDLLMQLTSSQETDVLKRDGKMNTQLQNMLTGLQFPYFLLEQLLPALFKLVPRKDIAEAIYGVHLRRVVKYIFRLLCVLAKDHRGNSEYLFDHIKDFQTMLGYGFGVADTLTEIFTDERELMVKATDDLIEEMWSLAKQKRERRYIDFLCVLVSDSSSGQARPVKSNQDRVSKIIRENMDTGRVFDVDLDNYLRRVHVKEQTGLSKFKAAAHLSKDGSQVHAEDPEILAVLDYHKELEFHLELILLTAYLCSGRHRQSIDYFLTDPSVGLSYTVVLSRSVGQELKMQTLDNGIPCSIRTVYTLLMRTLFIDREPAEYNTPVQTSRIMPPLGNDAKAIESRFEGRSFKRVIVNPYEGMEGVKPPTEGFVDLKSAIVNLFNSVEKIVVADTHQNLFLAELVALVREMLLFGMLDKSELPEHLHDGVLTLGDVDTYAETSEAIKLGRGLLNMLNGAEDDLTGVDLTGFGVINADQDIIRFDMRLIETTTVMSLRKKTLALIMDLFGLRASTKVSLDAL
jgi:hypothetical protein